MSDNDSSEVAEKLHAIDAKHQKERNLSVASGEAPSRNSNISAKSPGDRQIQSREVVMRDGG